MSYVILLGTKDIRIKQKSEEVGGCVLIKFVLEKGLFKILYKFFSVVTLVFAVSAFFNIENWFLRIFLQGSLGLTYTIKVANNGSYSLKNNTLYFTARKYMKPVEAKVTEGDKELINPGEQARFTVSAEHISFEHNPKNCFNPKCLLSGLIES